MRAFRQLLLIAVAFWSMALLPVEAHAATLSCDHGSASGDLFPASGAGSMCSNVTPVFEHPFSWVACKYTEILNDVLGGLYCSMIWVFKIVVGAVITLYVTLFGVQITLGMTQLTAREIVTRLLKIAFVWIFITQATFGVNYAFDFLITLAGAGISWSVDALSSYLPPACLPGPGGGTCSAPLSTPNIVPIYGYLDTLVYAAIVGPFTAANSKLLGFFAGLLVIDPPLFGLAVYWLMSTMKILIRAIISFLLAISAMAFLLALSPIFLSLMLFQITYLFFENWLKYLISYALQSIIVFSCIACWLATLYVFIGFFNNLSDVIFPYNRDWQTGSAVLLKSNWGICPYDVAYNTTGPRVKCQNPSFNPVPPNPPVVCPPGVPCTDVDKLIPLADIADKSDFIYYIVYNLITLIIICYAFDALLREAPNLAIQLAGPQYVPLLGQGFGYSPYGQMKGMMYKHQQMQEARSGAAGIAKEAGGTVKELVRNIGGQQTHREAGKT